MIELHDFNALPRAGAIEELRRCCGTLAWCERMADGRPFADRASLHAAAEREWKAVGPEGWREAFAHHPRIGGTEELRKKFSAPGNWASEEQSGVTGASEGVLLGLVDGNVRYEAKYGHLFLVCATGKTASEMLTILEARMLNTPEVELRIAAGEQEKITRLRLEKLIS